MAAVGSIGKGGNLTAQPSLSGRHQDGESRRWRRTGLWAGLVCLLCLPVHAQQTRPEVTIDPGGVPPTVLQAVTASVDHIVSLSQDQDGGEVDRLRRRARDVTITALATEGYFAPTVTLEVGSDVRGETWDIVIEPGERSMVSSVNLDFQGAITGSGFEQRLQSLKDDWGLPAGEPFRNEQWASAKRELLAGVSQTDFALARLRSSQARVNVDTAKVDLTVNVMSGPRVILGELQTEGLRRVPESLIRRYVRYEPGVTPYDRSEMVGWQQEMQSTVFFSSVDVRLASQSGRGATPAQAADLAAESAGAGDLDAVQPPERSAEGELDDADEQDEDTAAEADTKLQPEPQEVNVNGLRFSERMALDTLEIPVRVAVMEAPARRVGLALGVDSDVGLKAEGTYQKQVVWGLPLEVQAGLGLDRKRQRGYVDIYLPPDPRGYRDKFGVLAERHDLSGQRLRRLGLGAERSQTRKAAGDSRVEFETRTGVLLAYDRVDIEGGESYTLPSAVATFSWLRRDVDSKYNPRSGHLVEVGVGAGSALNKVQPFTRLQLRGQYWWPLGKRDLITVRGEVGQVWARDDLRIPADFGFRTGGARTIRGYRYLRLGLAEGDAIVGAPALAVASVEYQHFFTDTLGMGLFVDAGDADRSFREMDIAVSVGGGLRVRTPAGPIFVDLAYAARDKRVRLNFSLGIAF